MAMFGCGGEKRYAHKWMGTWMHVKVWHPSGDEFSYPDANGFTGLEIFTNDSVTYECAAQLLNNAITITPYKKASYHCIEKPDGSYLYFEDGKKYPLKLLNDTTLMIQREGVRYYMVRASGVVKRNEDRIIDIVSRCDYSGDEPHKSQPIAYGGGEFLNDSHVSRLALVVLLLLAAAIIAYALRVHSKGKRLAAQLKAIDEERGARTEETGLARKKAENQFLISDYYNGIHRRIACGESLKGEDWAEMKRQLDSVYPGFTARLLSLARMSEVELRCCMLVKMRVSPKDMSFLLNLGPSSVSSVRSRLYQKVFGKKGSAAAWDGFVMEL